VTKIDMWLYVCEQGKIRYSEWFNKFPNKTTFHKYKKQLVDEGKVKSKRSGHEVWYYVPKAHEVGIKRLILHRERLKELGKAEPLRPYVFRSLVSGWEESPQGKETIDAWPEPSKTDLKNFYAFLKSDAFSEILTGSTSVLKSIRDTFDLILKTEQVAALKENSRFVQEEKPNGVIDCRDKETKEVVFSYHPNDGTA
jgi:hypothetical protein